MMAETKKERHGSGANEAKAQKEAAPSRGQKETLMDVAIRRSILIPSSEIYGSPAGFYDYGPVGCAIKRKIEDLWRQEFLQKDGFHEIETAIILPEAVLKASGHAENFADPLVSCPSCKNKFRADHLLAENADAKKDGVNAEGLPPQKLSGLLSRYKAKCPACGKGGLSEVGWFNLMFKTNIGPIEGNTAYCRPETAQGIFLDFARIVRNYGSRLPIGIGQVGRSFRNEISPRQGSLRRREFTQMELEYFFNPSDQSHPNFGKIKHEKLRFANGNRHENIEIGKAVSEGLIPNEIMAYFLYKQKILYLAVGIPEERFAFRRMPPEETPHYSRGNIDLEVETSSGVVETVGTAYRTDYDLSCHAKATGIDLSVFVEEEKKRIIPHVVEPSMGADRLFWCVLDSCFRARGTGGKEWDWFDFPPAIAPYHAWVFPLMKKEGLDEKAREAEAMLRESGLTVYYQESGSIGRRYARADEIGVPYCITIDFDTLSDGTATLRFRNDGKQVRVKLGELAGKIASFVKEGKVGG